MIKIAPQRGDDPRLAALGQGADRAKEGIALVRREVAGGEQLFELIEDQHQPCGGLNRRILGLGKHTGRLGQIASQQEWGRFGIAAQRRPPAFAAVVPSLANSGRASGRSRAAARPSNRSPARSLGRRMARRQSPTPSTTPGSTKSGSTPARTSDDLPQPLAPSTSRNARPSAACRFSRSMDFADRPRAAEEDRVVLELEDLQTAERTALGPCRPDRPPRVEACPASATALDQLAEVLLQPGLEVGRVVERMKGGDQRAVFAVEEPLHELIQQDLLLERPECALAVSFKLTSGSDILR